MTQQQAKDDLINQAYEKLMADEQQRVGNIEDKEFILNRGHITASQLGNY